MIRRFALKTIAAMMMFSMLVTGCISTQDQRAKKEDQSRKTKEILLKPISTHDIIGKSVEILKVEEGYSSTPYYDSKGYITVGYGLLITKDKSVHLRDVPIKLTKSVAEMLLYIKVTKIHSMIESEEWFSRMGEDRAAIVISMIYQMGYNGFMKFEKTIKMMKNSNYKWASYEMLDSDWARYDSPNRAERHARVMRGGSIKAVYGGW